MQRVFTLSISSEEESLSGLASLMMELINTISVVHITHDTIKTAFMFLAKENGCLYPGLIFSWPECLIK
jgi:hypothetical protein